MTNTDLLQAISIYRDNKMQTVGFLYNQKQTTMYHVVSRVLIYLTLIFCKFGCNLIHKHFQGLLRTNLQMTFIFEVIY